MKHTSPTGRRTRRPLRAAALAVLTALLAVLVPVASPTPASAAGSYSGSVVVFPVLNCIQSGTRGAYTAVLGYKNTSTGTYTLTGNYNVISPSSYNGRQPTTFKPGTYDGAFSLSVSSGTVYWTLGTTKLTISRTSAAACPTDTQMPADGNGTGVVGALAVAAGLGALVVRRARRRVAVPPVEETVDA